MQSYYKFSTMQYKIPKIIFMIIKSVKITRFNYAINTTKEYIIF